MDFSKCHFYEMQSKRKLLDTFNISEEEYFKSINNYNVFIIGDEKKRLVEQPMGNLVNIQKRMKKLFDKNISKNLPNYVLCKKGSSWIDAVKLHMDNDNILVFDISKFFPSITYEMIVKLFTKHFKTSTVVAEMLTKLLVIDYDKLKNAPQNEVVEWYRVINDSRIKPLPKCHLCTGSCMSVLISELAVYDMLEEINSFCVNRKYTFGSYVDDFHISSPEKFSKSDSRKVVRIIKSFGFEVNSKKIRVYTRKNDAIINGVVRKRKSKNLTITYKMENKIKKLIEKRNENGNDIRLDAMMNVVKNIDLDKYKYYNYIINQKQ